MERESNIEPRGTSGGGKRTRMVRPYPINSVEDALAVAAAIQEANAGLPFDRVHLARALGTTPASSGFTMRLNSSAKYGLTKGGYNDDLISLTPRGEAIVAPKGSNELRAALIEAATEPGVFGQFYTILDEKRLPEDTYAQNMLYRELGVRRDLAAECLSIIKANGLYAGLLSQADGSLTVDLRRARELAGARDVSERSVGPVATADPTARLRPRDDTTHSGRIFIGHTGDSRAVEFLRELLDEFGISYAIADGDAAGPQPVPTEVADAMRNCDAAVLVFPDDDKRDKRRGPEMWERMLYQLGAASVLFDNRVVVVVSTGLNARPDVADIPSIEFDHQNPDKTGLALLRELHRRGAIRIGA